MVKDEKKDSKRRKEVKIVGTVKPKIKVIGENDDRSELEEDIKDSENSTSRGKTGEIMGERSGMASVNRFRGPSVVLEAGEEMPRGEIENATREKRRFDNEEAVKERKYATGRRQAIQRDSYESAYYTAGGGTAGAAAGRVISADRSIEQRQAIRRGGSIQPAGARESEGKEERYQTQQGQQKRRRYPWEV